MLEFQSKNIIQSTSEDSDNQAGLHNIIDGLNHKNDEISTSFNNNVNDLINKYQTKTLNDIDKKILKGLVQKEFIAEHGSYEQDGGSESNEQRNSERSMLHQINEPMSYDISNEHRNLNLQHFFFKNQNKI